MRVSRDGILVDQWTADNLVLSGAGQVNAQLIGGAVAGNSIIQIGFGSNLSPSVLANTQLSTDAYIKAIDTVTYPQPNQVAFGISLSAFEANGSIIAEYGLLCANGILYSRLVRGSALIKDQSMALSAVWTISF